MELPLCQQLAMEAYCFEVIHLSVVCPLTSVSYDDISRAISLKLATVIHHVSVLAEKVFKVRGQRLRF